MVYLEVLAWGVAAVSIAVIWKLSVMQSSSHRPPPSKPTQKTKKIIDSTELEHHYIFWHPGSQSPVETRVPLLFGSEHLRDIQKEARTKYNGLKIEISIQDNNVTGTCFIIHPTFTLTQLLTRYSSYFYALYAAFSPNMSRIQFQNRIRHDLSRLIADEHVEVVKRSILHVLHFLVHGEVIHGGGGGLLSKNVLHFFGVPELMNDGGEKSAEACLADDWMLREHESDAYERMFPGRRHPIFGDTYAQPFRGAAGGGGRRILPVMKRCYAENEKAVELPWFWERELPLVVQEKTEYRQAHYLWLTNLGERNVLPQQRHRTEELKIRWVPDYYIDSEKTEGQTEDKKDEKHAIVNAIRTATTTTTSTMSETVVRRTGAERLLSLRRLIKPLTDALGTLEAAVQKTVWISGPSIAEILYWGTPSLIATQEPLLDVWIIAPGSDLNSSVHKLCQSIKPTPPETVTIAGSLNRDSIFLHQYVVKLTDSKLTIRFHTIPSNEVDDERAAFYLLAHQPIDGYAVLWKPDTQTLWWLARTEDSTLTRSQCMYPCLYSNPLVFRLLYDGWALLLPTWLYDMENDMEDEDAKELAIRMSFPYVPQQDLADPNTVLGTMSVQTWAPLSIENQARQFYRKYTEWFIQTHHYQSPPPGPRRRKQLTQNLEIKRNEPSAQ